VVAATKTKSVRVFAEEVTPKILRVCAPSTHHVQKTHRKRWKLGGGTYVCVWHVCVCVFRVCGGLDKSCPLSAPHICSCFSFSSFLPDVLTQLSHQGEPAFMLLLRVSIFFLYVVCEFEYVCVEGKGGLSLFWY
jgi:hypothetical protein